MKRREEQAFNDGRLAFCEGRGEHSCSRKSVTQRAQWMRGFEHERRIDLAAKVTPQQRAEAASVLARFKDWAGTL